MHRDQRSVLDPRLAGVVGLVAEPADLALAGQSDAERRAPWPNTRTCSPGAGACALLCRRSLAGPDEDKREGTPWLVHLLGRIGDAQLGPIYLGWLGVVSLVLGFAAIEIIGLNMLASVNWDPIQFVRQLPWLALDPPAAEYGLKIPPLNQGGWWLMAGFCLTMSILLWWARYRRRAALGLGTHVAWAFAAAIWLYLVLGFIRR